MMKKTFALVVPLLLVMIVPVTAHAQNSILRELENAFIGIGAEIRPTVVTVDVEGKGPSESPMGMPQGEDSEDLQRFFRFFGPPQPEGMPFQQRQMPRMRGEGSGFVYDKQGHIITNNHVISDAEKITVRFADGWRTEAQVVGADPDTDIAVIKIDPQGRDLPVARLGSSGEIKVGQFAIAVGSPGGLEGSFSFGHVSALGREGLSLGEDMRFQDFIQTDAAITLGNSGGPLCNIDGEVIGINVAIVWPPQSVGFAIPIDRAREIVPVLISDGKITRGYLGVSIGNLEDIARNSGTTLTTFLEALGLPDAQGAYVHDVSVGTPAERAGIQADDVVRKLNGTQVKDSTDLMTRISQMSPGASVELEVWREGEPQTISMKLGEYPGSLTKARFGAEILGLHVQDLTAEMASKFKLDTETKGVLVVDVAPDSPAFEAGIGQGDVIVKVQQQDVANEKEFRKLVKDAVAEGKPLLVRVIHPGGQRELRVIEIPEDTKME